MFVCDKVKSVGGAALSDRGPELALKELCTYYFQFYPAAIVVAEVPKTIAFGSSLAHSRLIHRSGYSSNCSASKTEMDIAHVEILISNCLLYLQRQLPAATLQKFLS